MAQASDALKRIKAKLCTYQGLVRYKIKHVAGPRQATNMHARNLLVQFKKTIHRATKQYRATCAALVALVALDPNGDWQKNLCTLHDDDLKGPNGVSFEEALDNCGLRRGAGEGYRVLSWIWRVHLGPASDNETDNDDQCMCSVFDICQKLIALAQTSESNMPKVEQGSTVGKKKSC